MGRQPSRAIGQIYIEITRVFRNRTEFPEQTNTSTLTLQKIDFDRTSTYNAHFLKIVQIEYDVKKNIKPSVWKKVDNKTKLKLIDDSKDGSNRFPREKVTVSRIMNEFRKLVGQSNPLHVNTDNKR